MMARETSIYTGVTVAEYFRDMGYHAVVIADSTSRWAEALREFASRSGALPAEEGYPGLARRPHSRRSTSGPAGSSRSAATGSVTIIGAVSPPGGDMTEPVTAHTERFVRGAVDPRPRPRLRPPLSRGRLGRLVLPGRRPARAAGTPATATRSWATRRARIDGAAGRGRPAGRARRAGRAPVPARPRARRAARRAAAARGRAAAERAVRQRRPLHGRPRPLRCSTAVLDVVDECDAMVERGDHRRGDRGARLLAAAAGRAGDPARRRRAGRRRDAVSSSTPWRLLR